MNQSSTQQPQSVNYTVRPLYCHIAHQLFKYHTSQYQPQVDEAEDVIRRLCKIYLPHGSGFDMGCELDLPKSKHNKLVILFEWHNMDENGFYDGWYSYKCVVLPSFVWTIDMRITGREPRTNFGLKDYFYETLNYHLTRPIRQYYNNGNLIFKDHEYELHKESEVFNGE